MGATTFSTTQRGTTAAEAFREAVRRAQYESGHGGYTGTIAEKDDFKVFTLPQGMELRTFVNKVQRWDLASDKSTYTVGALQTLENAAEIANDKYGDAVCVEIPQSTEPDGTRAYVFFGLAAD